MTSTGERTGNRAFDACIGTLVAASALYGAVWILSKIWVSLLIIAIVTLLVAVTIIAARWWWVRW